MYILFIIQPCLIHCMAVNMLRIKQSSIAQALQEGGQHIFTVYEYPDGYVLTLDDLACLETARGELRKFRKLGALVGLIKELGIGGFTVSLKPYE